MAVSVPGAAVSTCSVDKLLIVFFCAWLLLSESRTQWSRVMGCCEELIDEKSMQLVVEYRIGRCLDDPHGSANSDLSVL